MIFLFFQTENDIQIIRKAKYWGLKGLEKPKTLPEKAAK